MNSTTRRSRRSASRSPAAPCGPRQRRVVPEEVDGDLRAERFRVKARPRQRRTNWFRELLGKGPELRSAVVECLEDLEPQPARFPLHLGKGLEPVRGDHPDQPATPAIGAELVLGSSGDDCQRPGFTEESRVPATTLPLHSGGCTQMECDDRIGRSVTVEVGQAALNDKPRDTLPTRRHGRGRDRDLRRKIRERRHPRDLGRFGHGVHIICSISIGSNHRSRECIIFLSVMGLRRQRQLRREGAGRPWLELVPGGSGGQATARPRQKKNPVHATQHVAGPSQPADQSPP